MEDGQPDLREFENGLEKLEDGEYGYLLFDKEKNKTLPQLKYLHGIVLKTISEKLPNHPPVSALYRYFEGLYAPELLCQIQGKTFSYVDLKGCKSSEMNEVIEKIIHHSKNQWNIDVLSRENLKLPECSEAYAGAYAEDWTNYLRTI